MSEVIQETLEDSKSRTRKRNLILLGTLIPLAAFFAILGWGVARSGGNPGGFGINSEFTETALAEQPAPLFEGTTLDGEAISLGDLKGKLVLVDFWSSWCPPCRQEGPALAQVYREFQDEDVEFIGVAIWDRESKVAEFIDEIAIPYPNIMDDRGAIAIDYGVSGIPEKYLVDPDGNLIRKFVGPVQPDDLRNALNAVLNQ